MYCSVLSDFIFREILYLKTNKYNMIICYFGNYNPEYARNRVLIKGLKENGVNVIECCEQSSSLALFANLIKKHRQLPVYDRMIVGYTDSRWVVVLGRLLCRKVFVWDAFYSLYDSWVFDRKLADKYSPKAAYYWLMDWLCCQLAGKILLDTKGHLHSQFHIFRKSQSKGETFA